VNRLDRFVLAVQIWQRRYALRIAKICLIAFVANCGFYGFAAAVVPQASAVFALNAVTLLIGAIANFILASRHGGPDRTN
jgi:hypothetical protein